jgi:hypothetical protein
MKFFAYFNNCLNPNTKALINALTSGCPVAKMRWETPKLISSLPDEIQSGRCSSVYKRLFLPNSNGYSIIELGRVTLTLPDNYYIFRIVK